MQVVLPSRLELPFHGMSFVENLLITKSTNELNFTQARDPMLTVEIDLDSLPDSPYGYGQLVESCLAPLAAAKPDLRASIYVSHRPSVSFGNYGSSALFGIAGDSRVLAALFSCFRNAPGLKVGHGDQIIQSEALRQYHIEGGLLWRPDEEHVWYANEVDHKNGRPNDNIEFGPGRDPGIELDPEPEQGPEAAALGRTELPARFRAARSDASVGSIAATIEEVFGLPEGSVGLRGPDKKALRSDATIRTLRKRWE
jgi:hypothetical protein